MSEEAVTPPPAPEAPSTTAGRLLRRAREAQGLHIAALAASLKVTPGKLDALENDRYDELPDAAFTRALAKTMCRALKVDPAPVLELLPPLHAGKLDEVLSGLNTPFREHPSPAHNAWSGIASRPVGWAVVLLLVGALVVFFWPAPPPTTTAELELPSETTVIAPAAEPAPVADPVAPPASAPMVETVHAAPAAEAPASAAAPAPPPMLALSSREPSWIEVIDADGRRLISRTVQPGEAVNLDGVLPLRLTVGNAGAADIAFRGQRVDLAPHMRGSIARLELK